ncbi:MAG: hypothetical protein JW931_02605 [Methanomicrobiaceae archaeon]|nr:hypothetical protein [Methanomicrobiaceae archaeon]
MKILLASSSRELDEKDYGLPGCFFIDLIRDEKIRSFIKKTGVKEIDLSGKIQETGGVQVLVDEYLKLMSRISEENNNIFWWSTFTSSKNRFMTNTFVNLCSFHALTGEIEELTENSDCQILTITATPGILQSVSVYLNRKGIPYEYKYDKSSIIRRDLLYLWNCVKNSAIFTFLTWQRIFTCRMRLGKKIKRSLENPPDDPYVIRTWIYERSFTDENEYRDSFFGVLPEHISKKQPLILIGGIIGDYKAICNKIRESDNFTIIPQEFFLGYKSPVKTLFSLRKNRIMLKETLFFGNDVSGIINHELSLEYSDRTLPESFQFSYFIENMLMKIPPADFLTTYENNPWEKVCFIRLKELSGKTRITGYQHSVVSKYSLNMFFPKESLSTTPRPDKVITVGNITRDILIDMGGYDESMVFSGCGLRFMHLFNIERRSTKPEFKTILVTPEGIPEESIKICNFVYEALKDVTGVKVIIRAHPALPYEKFAKDLVFRIDSVPHFEISDKPSVMDDLNRSDIVIYRGSTLALEAVKTGLYAIYLHLGDLIPVDPLFGLSALKYTIKNPEEVKKALNSVYSKNTSEYLKEADEASSYLDDYFHKITEDNMDIFLN